MKRTAMTGLAVAFAVAAASPVAAQEYRFDIGVDGGFAYFTSSLTEDDGLPEDVQFGPGWIAGFEATGWITPRWGLRFDLGYTEKSLKQGDTELLFEDEDGDLMEDINMWDVAGSLVFRFAGPEPGEFLGLEVMPYISAGAGVKIFDPATDGEFFGFLPTREPPAVDSMFLAGKTMLEGRAALGADFRVLPRLVIRAEVGDIFFDSPIYETAADDEDVGKVVHELYGTLGLAVPLGFIYPPPVAVAPPPPPPAPAPPPPPAEETVRVCVIDPMAPNGVQTVEAIYLVEQGDTVVVRNGQRVAIATAFGNVPVAPNQNWYIAGEPLVFEMDDARTEFVSYGGARVIPSGSLALLGWQNGVPVYADADDVADVREQWEDMREEAAQNDLDDYLEQRDDLAEEFSEVQFVYVPMQPVGCVFQALQRVEEVRKGARN